MYTEEKFLENWNADIEPVETQNVVVEIEKFKEELEAKAFTAGGINVVAIVIALLDWFLTYFTKDGALVKPKLGKIIFNFKVLKFLFNVIIGKFTKK